MLQYSWRFFFHFCTNQYVPPVFFSPPPHSFCSGELQPIFSLSSFPIFSAHPAKQEWEGGKRRMMGMGGGKRRKQQDNPKGGGRETRVKNPWDKKPKNIPLLSLFLYVERAPFHLWLLGFPPLSILGYGKLTHLSSFYFLCCWRRSWGNMPSPSISLPLPKKAHPFFGSLSLPLRKPARDEKRGREERRN